MEFAASVDDYGGSCAPCLDSVSVHSPDPCLISFQQRVTEVASCRLGIGAALGQPRLARSDASVAHWEDKPGRSVDILFPTQLELLCNLSGRPAGMHQDSGIAHRYVCSGFSPSLQLPMKRGTCLELRQGLIRSFPCYFPRVLHDIILPNHEFDSLRRLRSVSGSALSENAGLHVVTCTKSDSLASKEEALHLRRVRS